MSVVAPPAATPEWLQLPRAAALTDALLAPAAPPDPAMQAALARELRQSLERVVGPSGDAGDGQCVRIGPFQLAEAFNEADADPSEPFRWSARTARRSLGLAAVAACAAGSVATPTAGVARAMTIVRGRGAPAPAIPDSLVQWAAGLPTAARAAVAAEATTWATRLWTAVEWGRLPVGTAVGGADEWWHHLAAGVRIAVRGRADVRTTTDDGTGVLLSVCGGWPTPAGRAALLLAALVAALHRPGLPGPGRVVGWWPDCGRAWIVPVDPDALSLAAEGVVTATRRSLRLPH